jgi:hypothetical protein
VLGFELKSAGRRAARKLARRDCGFKKGGSGRLGVVGAGDALRMARRSSSRSAALSTVISAARWGGGAHLRRLVFGIVAVLVIQVFRSFETVLMLLESRPCSLGRSWLSLGGKSQKSRDTKTRNEADVSVEFDCEICHSSFVSALQMSTVTAPLPLSDDHPDELLSRTITPPLQVGKFSFEEIYEIDRTKRLLREGNYRTIALQFPDEMLHDAAEVSRLLQDDGVKMYILADTSYGRYNPWKANVVVALTRLRRNMSTRMSSYTMAERVFLRMSQITIDIVSRVCR